MTYSALTVFLMVVGVTYGRQWNSVEELETYLITEYDGSVGSEDSNFLPIWHETIDSSPPSGVATMWSSGLVRYQIDPAASHERKEAILAAMRLIEKVSCVKFRPSKQPDALKIAVEREAPDQCYSIALGYQAENKVHLGSLCFPQYVIIHELLHTLGMSHQQKATNRDQYITIHLQNIPEELHSQYDKNDVDLPAEQVVGYDYESIMHYDPIGVHDNIRFLAMSSKNPYVPLKENRYMSHKDIMKLNIMYNCISNY